MGLTTFAEVKYIEDEVLPPAASSRPIEDPVMSRFRGLPFWIIDKEKHRQRYYETHGNCCFNHVLGLPKKEGKELPLFDYEIEIIVALDNHKRLWIKKARGLGITELMLRYMAWLCLRDNEMQGAQMAIIVGPKEELGIKLINRMKEKIGLQRFFAFDTNAKTVFINGCEIQAYPSNHTETLRSPENMRFILLDECDFFAPNEIKVVVDAAEGYTAKSKPWIVMVSTPNMPGGYYDTVENNKDSSYHKIIILFERGMPDLVVPNQFNAENWEAAISAAVVKFKFKKLAEPEKVKVAILLQDQLVKDKSKLTIYSIKDILEAGTLDSWQREYCGRYGYGVGNIFPQELLKLVTQEEYPLAMQGGQKVLFYDPGFGNDAGGSKFAILGCEMVDGIIYVRHCQQYARANPEAMIAEIYYQYTSQGYQLIKGDSARPDIIRALADGSEKLERKPCNVDSVVFRDTLTEMTNVAPTRVRERQVRIHPTFTDLINQLRAVEFDGKGHPDKKKLRFDLGDCFLMAMHHFDVGDVVINHLGNDDANTAEQIMDVMGIGADAALYQPINNQGF